MPALKTPLPEELWWLTEKVESLSRPVAHLRPDPARVAEQGSTRTWGLPDLPADAVWARFPEQAKHWNVMPWSWGRAPCDGESFMFQLDLAEIPASVRKSEWPAVGVVWVFIDLSTNWRADVQFDPRERSAIPWKARLDDKAPRAAQWNLSESMPDGTEVTMPEIWDTWREQGGPLSSYTDWAQANYLSRRDDVQVGGWVWPCQGDFDTRNEDFVCGVMSESFGDCGYVYLHFNTERGFYALVETS